MKRGNDEGRKSNILALLQKAMVSGLLPPQQRKKRASWVVWIADVVHGVCMHTAYTHKKCVQSQKL